MYKVDLKGIMIKDFLIFCFIVSIESIYLGILSCFPSAYNGKYPSQLSNRERRIKQGVASISDKFEVFYLNAFATFLYPTALLFATIIFIIYKIICR